MQRPSLIRTSRAMTTTEAGRVISNPSFVQPKPSAPHPAALALFKSLDLDLADRRKREKCSKGDLEDTLGTTSGTTKKEGRHAKDRSDPQQRGSTLLRRRVQSAGWRNRHSQSDLYPVNMTTTYARAISCTFPKEEECTLTACDDKSQPNENGEIDITFHVRQVQCGEMEETYGTGATVWPASMVLLKYMEKISTNGLVGCGGNGTGFFEGKTVADLGSGTGLTSVAAALLGASLVICSDGCELVVDLARDNVSDACEELQQTLGMNDTKGFGRDVKQHQQQQQSDRQNASENPTFWIGRSEIRVRKYLWGDGSMACELDDGSKNYKHSSSLKYSTMESSFETTVSGGSSQNHYDVILVSDCVLPKLYPIRPLVDAIDELSGPNTVSLLSYEQRYYPQFDPKDEFCRLAKERNLEVKTVPHEELDPIYSVEDIEIWQVTRK